MSAHRRDFDETKYIPFLIKHHELLEKYDKIKKEVKTGIKKEFASEPVYNEKCLKAKIKSYNWKINTNFYNNKIPKEGSQFICLSIILIDSVFRAVENYYSQVFLDECKYVAKDKKMPEFITYDIKFFSDDSDQKDSNEEVSSEKYSDKKIPVTKIIYRVEEYNDDFKRFMKYSYNLHNSYFKVNF